MGLGRDCGFTHDQRFHTRALNSSGVRAQRGRAAEGSSYDRDISGRITLGSGF